MAPAVGTEVLAYATAPPAPSPGEKEGGGIKKADGAAAVGGDGGAASGSKPKRFVCEVCGMRFGYNHHLKKHMLGQHQGALPMNHACRYCNKKFYEKYHLAKHEKTHESSVRQASRPSLPSLPSRVLSTASGTGASALCAHCSLSPPHRQVEWEMRLEDLIAFRKQYGHQAVPTSNVELTNWISYQQKAKREGKLRPDKAAKLEAAGFDWGRQGPYDPKTKRGPYFKTRVRMSHLPADNPQGLAEAAPLHAALAPGVVQPVAVAVPVVSAPTVLGADGAAVDVGVPLGVDGQHALQGGVALAPGEVAAALHDATVDPERIAGAADAEHLETAPPPPADPGAAAGAPPDAGAHPDALGEALGGGDALAARKRGRPPKTVFPGGAPGGVMLPGDDKKRRGEGEEDGSPLAGVKFRRGVAQAAGSGHGEDFRRRLSDKLRELGRPDEAERVQNRISKHSAHRLVASRLAGRGGVFDSIPPGEDRVPVHLPLDPDHPGMETEDDEA